MMYPIAMLGTLCAGGIWSPTPYNLGAAELARHLNITQPKVVFCSEDLFGTVREACEIAGIAPSKIYKVASSPRNITNVEMGKSLIGKSKLEWDRSTDVKFLKETVILLHFTSGTTGLPKFFILFEMLIYKGGCIFSL
jgi:4-coumarate--CoA ligase